MGSSSSVTIYICLNLVMFLLMLQIPQKIPKYKAELIEKYKGISYITPSTDLFVKCKPRSKLNHYDVELTKAEIALLKWFEKRGEQVVLIAEDKVNAKNDFIWRGKSWELKTVVKNSKYSIRNAIWRATSQKKRNIILDLTYLSVDFDECLVAISDTLEKTLGINSLIVIRRNIVVRIK